MVNPRVVKKPGMDSKTLKPNDPALLRPLSTPQIAGLLEPFSAPRSTATGILSKPPFRLPSQRYPNMVTSNTTNQPSRRGLFIDILA